MLYMVIILLIFLELNMHTSYVGLLRYWLIVIKLMSGLIILLNRYGWRRLREGFKMLVINIELRVIISCFRIV
jgi:hypothetical protein